MSFDDYAGNYQQQPQQGGFLSDGGGNSSQGRGGKGGGERSKAGVRSVTIRQMLQLATQEGHDGAFLLDGKELSHVKVVGEIISRNDHTTHVAMVIDDGTGRIETRSWIDSEDSVGGEEQRATWKVGSYVSVFGQIRSQANGRSLISFAVKPMTQFDELTFHFLECIHSHLSNTTSGALVTPMQGVVHASSSYGGGGAARGNNNNQQQQGGGGGGGISGPVTVKQLADDIINVFNRVTVTESGMSIGQICQELNGNFSAEHVKEAIDYLMDEGQMFTTMDDNHFSRI